jgi:hypothetical protein
MTGDNVTESKHPMWSLGWRLEKIAKDIDGTLKYYEVSDRTSKCKRIVIEYDHQSKD